MLARNHKIELEGEDCISTSRRVRAVDFDQLWFKLRSAELNQKTVLHRKLWEHAIVAQVLTERLSHAGLTRAIGFGVGRDPITSWLAARNNVTVLATDAPIDDNIKSDWSATGQHADCLEDTFHPGICSREQFYRAAFFRHIDMRNLPLAAKLGNYDFSWSCGSFEHIGPIDTCLQFFVNQMACLRPGGITVHTTEYNPDDSKPTLEASNIVLLQKSHLERLESMLAAQGDLLLPLDLAPGNDPADTHIDRPPYSLPQLSIEVCGGHVTTSIALIAIRGGAK